MSSFVVEPAASSSQLYFAFCGVAEADLPAEDAPASGGRASRVRNANNRHASNLHRGRQAEGDGLVTGVSVQAEASAKGGRPLPAKEVDNARARHANGRESVRSDTRSAAAQGLPRQRSERRIAQPVRIGKVMLDLLRRYGITDEEIEEGLQAYARSQPAATFANP